MLIFDILDKLENYSKIIPHMDSVIDIMDHSKPYDDAPGEYDGDKKGDVKYVVSVERSTERGREAVKREGKLVLEIVLEGEELLSVSGSVFSLAPGRFLVYESEKETKRGIAVNLPSTFKAVRFYL